MEPLCPLSGSVRPPTSMRRVITMAITRPTSQPLGERTVRRYGTGYPASTAAVHSVTWGSGNDFPVQGDYDGDGKTDIAIWRPGVNPGEAAFWAQLFVQRRTFGLPVGSERRLPGCFVQCVLGTEYDSKNENARSLWLGIFFAPFEAARLHFGSRIIQLL